MSTPNACIVGAGPAGIYTAKYLFKLFNGSIKVDFYDKCPFPYGLLRYGVSPDHPEMRLAGREFDRLCPRKLEGRTASCRFFGGITVTNKRSTEHCFQDSQHGSHATPLSDLEYGKAATVHISDLQRSYDVLVLAIGAVASSRLQLPGSSLSGILRGGDFIKWCNGFTSKQPVPLGNDQLEYATDGPGGDPFEVDSLLRDLSFLDTSTETVHPECPRNPRVVIIGLGNVALDVARILLKEPSTLPVTPTVRNALEVLSVKSVCIVGRRHLGANVFSPAELREVLNLPSVTKTRNASSLEPPAIRTRRSHKVKELFEQLPVEDTDTLLSSRATDGLHFVGGYTPHEYNPRLDNSSWVSCVRFKLADRDTTVLLPADLVIECVGFEQPSCTGFSLARNPKRLQLYPDNYQERFVVVDSTDAQVGELAPVYAAGWCITGSVGAIPETLADASRTAHLIKKDFDAKYWSVRTASLL